ncbi:MAG: serine/threonine-protein kinase, partial [Planctomycetota bacterium]
MNADRMRLVEQIFTEASACDNAAARDALLRTRCRDDSQLLDEVRTLLECAAEGDGVLDQSAPKLVDMPVPGEDPSLLPAGTRVGAYIIRSVLGIGGMGVVYLGEQARPNRTVALKVIRPGFATQSVLKRFEYEAELLGRLQHSGIAQIIEAGAAQTLFGMQPFFAMELVHGLPLTTFARDHKLGVRDKVELMVKVCEAVEHAHQRGVVHRDLKPAHILVNAQGQPKILDFGVARATGGREAEHRLTLMRTGERQLVGTLAYMSPEQVSGDASAIDTRSDVYALGVVLFELLSGTTPYELDKRSLPDAVRIIRDEDPRLLGSVAPSCGRDLEIICGQTLAKAPARRYQSAANLAADLRRFLDDVPILARAPSLSDHVRKFARRNTGVFAGGLVAVAAIVAGAVFGAVQYAKAVTARGQAEERAKEASRAEAKAVAERDAKERETANLKNTLKFTQDAVFAKAYETMPDQGRAVSVVDALRLAQESMAKEFSSDRLSEARLRFYSALIFMSNNEMDASLAAAARAAELLSQMGEERFEEGRPVEQHVIRLLAQLGRFDEGDRRARELVAKVRARNPTNDLAAQATLFVESGRFDLAERVLREQFTVVLDDPSITPLNTYVQTRRLGALLALLGRIDECESHWSDRISACKAHFGGGDEKPATTQFIATCADQLEEVGEFKRALPYRRRVYAVLPPEQWIARNMAGPFQLAATLRALREPAATIEAAELTGSLLAHTRATYGVRSTQLHQATASHIRSLVA